MSELEYDKKSPESIYEFALKLRGKCLDEVANLPPSVTNKRNRGDLGSLVEKYFFKHQPESNRGPDFAEAGLELKTTGVVRNKSGSYRAKERLVLTMINFESLASEKWVSSSFLKKCAFLLILFYQFDKEVPVHRRRFVLDPLLFRIPQEDLVIMERDWQLIRKKVQDGKAHELSEGDTFYLGACRKGSGGEKESLQRQPFSNVPAKSRAFSFKQSYVNKLIDGHLEGEVSLGVSNEISMEMATRERYAPYIGLSVSEISEILSLQKKTKNQKGFHKMLANKILFMGNQTLSELTKAGIELKTVRLRENGRPRESMSFPGFKTREIVNQEWEDSTFFERLERKFLLIVFKVDSNNVERLFKVAYWNMPYEDRVEAQRVWEETKKRSTIDSRNFPKKSESTVAHVRPKGRDGDDKELTPQGNMQVKQCFWLNSGYIARVIETL